MAAWSSGCLRSLSHTILEYLSALSLCTRKSPGQAAAMNVAAAYAVAFWTTWCRISTIRSSHILSLLGSLQLQAASVLVNLLCLHVRIRHTDHKAWGFLVIVPTPSTSAFDLLRDICNHVTGPTIACDHRAEQHSNCFVTSSNVLHVHVNVAAAVQVLICKLFCHMRIMCIVRSEGSLTMYLQSCILSDTASDDTFKLQRHT